MTIREGRDGPVRCLAYSSRMSRLWSDPELRRMGEDASRRNAARGITGHLLCRDGGFVGVLEGPPGEIDQLSATIRADARHHDFTILLDTLAQARSHADWRLTLQGEALPTPLDGYLFEQDAGDRDTSAEGFSAGLSAPFVARTLNVTPRQSRAVETVDRILAATLTLVTRHGEAGLSLKAVAEAANVSLTNAYRYVSSPDNLIRMLVRRQLVSHFTRVKAVLKTRTFPSVEALSGYLADEFAANFMKDVRVSNLQRLRGIEKYFDIAYGELAALAADCFAAMVRNGLCEREPDLTAEIAAALAAVGAAGRMAFLYHRAYFTDGRFHAAVRLLLAAAMQGPPTASAPPVRPPYVARAAEIAWAAAGSRGRPAEANPL